MAAGQGLDHSKESKWKEFALVVGGMALSVYLIIKYL
jgi:hypothetical protein